jgi:hypothetical protein
MLKTSNSEHFDSKMRAMSKSLLLLSVVRAALLQEKVKCTKIKKCDEFTKPAERFDAINPLGTNDSSPKWEKFWRDIAKKCGAEYNHYTPNKRPGNESGYITDGVQFVYLVCDFQETGLVFLFQQV